METKYQFQAAEPNTLAKSSPLFAPIFLSDDFQPAKKMAGGTGLSRPSLSYGQDVWRRFKKNKQALFSLLLIGSLGFFVCIGPFLWQVDPNQQGTQLSQGPTGTESAVIVDTEENAVPLIIQEPAPVTQPGPLLAVQNLRTIGIASTHDVRLQWEPVSGAESYAIYRSEVLVTANSTTELGIPVGETTAGNIVSFVDSGSLEKHSYYYSVLARNKDGFESGLPTTLEVKVEPGITLSQAQALNSRVGQDLKVGDTIQLKAVPFGTDSLGRDVLARIMYGGRISLFIGLVAALFEVMIGIFIGGVSGFFGGRLDHYIMRFTDFVLGLPFLLFMILLKVAMGVGPGESGISAMIIALVILSWPGAARLVRGQILQARESEFIAAARMMGAKPSYLILRHLIPNIMGTILVSITFGIPSAIFTEAWLSFIGLGVASPSSSWGSMSSDALQAILVHPHEFFLPSIFIGLTVLAFNLLGDGLRDALDPKMRANE